MKIAVLGLWHLGSVTAACLAHKGLDVMAYDSNLAVVDAFQKGKAPVFEPGLDALIDAQIKARHLRVTASLPEAIQSADLLWVTFDTPVDDHDHADLPAMRKIMHAILDLAHDGQSLLISSQVPVGFCSDIEQLLKEKRPAWSIPVAYSPENLRLGKAIEIFENPDRIVVGIRRTQDQSFYEPLLSAISKNIVWMKTESAEMTKHAINSFLATSVVFANELATLCEATGADAQEVEQGLKTETRIGPKAYLKAGAAFAGGTLARDVQFLTALAQENKMPGYLLNAVLQSNTHHREWAQRKLKEKLPRISGSQIALLGLTYKAGTDTLRRSWAIELARWLDAQGAKVKAFDWQLTQLPEELASLIDLKSEPGAAFDRSDGVVVCTDHPRLKDISIQDLRRLGHPVIIDPNGGLRPVLTEELRPLDYFSVGHTIHRS